MSGIIGLLIYVVSGLCSLLCCVLFWGVVIWGIMFLVKKSRSSGEAEVEDGSEAGASSDDAPEEETQKVPDEVPVKAEMEAEAASEEKAAVPDPAAESAEKQPAEDAKKVEKPPKNPKAAGQTIIAFDDDDEDF